MACRCESLLNSINNSNTDIRTKMYNFYRAYGLDLGSKNFVPRLSYEELVQIRKQNEKMINDDGTGVLDLILKELQKLNDNI